MLSFTGVKSRQHSTKGYGIHNEYLNVEVRLTAKGASGYMGDMNTTTIMQMERLRLWGQKISSLVNTK